MESGGPQITLATTSTTTTTTTKETTTTVAVSYQRTGHCRTAMAGVFVQPQRKPPSTTIHQWLSLPTHPFLPTTNPSSLAKNIATCFSVRDTSCAHHNHNHAAQNDLW